MITFDKFIQPFCLGYQLAKLAFSDEKVSTVAQRSFSERSKAATMHLFTAFMLWIPVINYFVQFIIERNLRPVPAPPSLPAQRNPADDESLIPNQEPPTPALIPEEENLAPNLEPAAAGIERRIVSSILDEDKPKADFTSQEKILNYFLWQLANAEKDKEPLESVPFYNQCYTNLVTLAECTFEEAKKLLMEPFLDEIRKSEKISDTLKHLALHYMENEFILQLVQGRVALPSQSWALVKAPADGSCMLWSYLLSERISRGQAEGETTQRYEGLNSEPSKHSEYEGLSSEMMALRKEIVQRFLSDIKGSLSDEFRKQFVYYVIGNQTVFDAVTTGESIDELLKTERPTESMIDKYVEFIMQRENWCGEFEAGIVAKLKERTIYILRGTSTENLTLGTVADGGYMASTNLDPVYIRNSGVHYDAVFPT